MPVAVEVFARMLTNNQIEEIKNSVLNRIAKGGSVSQQRKKAKYLVCGEMVHVRFCSCDQNNPRKFKFNINPTTVTAEYELLICGGESIFYLIPIKVIRKIYECPEAYPDRHHPRIRIFSVYPSSDRLVYGRSKELDISAYKNGMLREDIEQKKEALKRKYGSFGEGEDHKKLKEWVSKNPDAIGLAGVYKTEVETHVFPSGDVPDIVFGCENKKYAVVEVETTNVRCGAYQAIKYKVLLCAELGLPIESPSIDAMLVAWNITRDFKAFCHKYGVKYFEKKL